MLAVDPDPAPGPDPTPDPTPFFNDFKDVKKKFSHIFSYNLTTGTLSLLFNFNFLPNFVSKVYFVKHYFSPLNTFEGKRTDPRSQIWSSDSWIRKAQKHVDPANPDPDPQHWLSVKIHNRVQRNK
jgi:hypothetical protein